MSNQIRVVKADEIGTFTINVPPDFEMTEEEMARAERRLRGIGDDGEPITVSYYFGSPPVS